MSGVSHCGHNVSTATKARSNASGRINLRVQPQTKAKLLQAARLQKVKLTEFMIEAAEAAAELALAERTRFVLSPDKWQQFNAELDRPPRELPALRRLLRGPSIFEAP